MSHKQGFYDNFNFFFFFLKIELSIGAQNKKYLSADQNNQNFPKKISQDFLQMMRASI